MEGSEASPSQLLMPSSYGKTSAAQQTAYSKRMAAFVRAAESLGCCVLWSSPGMEADDMIGSLAKGLLVGA